MTHLMTSHFLPFYVAIKELMGKWPVTLLLIPNLLGGFSFLLGAEIPVNVAAYVCVNVLGI